MAETHDVTDPRGVGPRDPSTEIHPPGRRLPGVVDRAISIAVVPGDTEDTIRTKRLVTGAAWAGFLVAIPVATIQMFLFGGPISAAFVGCSLVSAGLALVVLWRWPETFGGVIHALVLVNILVSGSLVVVFGGLFASGFNLIWGLIVLLAGLAVFADRRAVIWLGIYLGVIVLSLLWAGRVEPVETLAYAEYVAVFNLIVVTLFVFGLVYYYVRQRAILLDQSESLLRNILPDQIAVRLKSSPGMIADGFAEASVLFADVAGFTPMSQTMAPAEIVSLLDEVFSGFDLLVEERGLEKIKTIGDAYMVAAGVPVKRPDHAVAICDLALEMRDYVADRDFQGRRLSFRMGINSGPVVAGIIGRRKFSYDLWGDSVNTASRMESFGSAGHIQVTEATVRLVEDEFVCEPRGVIEVKGKGPMPVWYLTGRR